MHWAVLSALHKIIFKTTLRFVLQMRKVRNRGCFSRLHSHIGSRGTR